MHSNHYSTYIMVENWQSSKCGQFVKNYFLGIKILHAYLQYVCNIPAKYLKDSVKTLGRVDFTKYAISSIILYTKWSKTGKVQNAFNLSKIIFLPLKLFMHIFNMYVTYLQSIKSIPCKLFIGVVDFTNYALSVLLKTYYSKIQSGITLAILTFQSPFS